VKPIEYPPWVPAAVSRMASEMLAETGPGHAQDVLVERLATSTEMEVVWNRLLRCPCNADKVRAARELFWQTHGFWNNPEMNDRDYCLADFFVYAVALVPPESERSGAERRVAKLKRQQGLLSQVLADMDLMKMRGMKECWTPLHHAAVALRMEHDKEVDFLAWCYPDKDYGFGEERAYALEVARFLMEGPLVLRTANAQRVVIAGTVSAAVGSTVSPYNVRDWRTLEQVGRPKKS
jgi:hypothetical protein